MVSSYSSRLRFELPGAGDYPNTWGSVANTIIGTTIEEAIAGYTSIALSDANYTLSTANGSSDQARQAMIRFTGTLTADRNITIPSVSKLYVISNATTGGFNVAIKTSSGSSVNVPSGTRAFVMCDGADCYLVSDSSSVILSLNRVDNAGFGIKQRSEFTSGSSLASGSYGHDRWKAGSGGCTYTFSGSSGDTTITLTAGSLQQVIPGDQLPEGGTYTLAWNGTAQGRINGGGYAASPITVTGISAAANMTIEFNTGTLSRVRLFSGAVDFGWTPKNQDDELQRCLRYYREWGGGDVYQYFFPGIIETALETMFAVTLNPPMRSTPTVTFSDKSHFQLCSQIPPTPASITADLRSPQGFRIYAVPSVTFGSGGYAVTLRANNTLSARIRVSADL